MAELIVLSFPTQGGARRLLREIVPLQHEHLIKLKDIALAVKDGKKKIRVSQLHPTTLEVLLRGSLWGTLAGALFLEPFFGLLVGGTTALILSSTKSTDHLISRRMVARTATKKLEPNQSALFLMVAKATPDKVMAELHDHDATIVSTSLSTADEQALRESWKRIKTHGPLALHNQREGPRTQLLPEPTRYKTTA